MTHRTTKATSSLTSNTDSTSSRSFVIALTGSQEEAAKIKPLRTALKRTHASADLSPMVNAPSAKARVPTWEPPFKLLKRVASNASVSPTPTNLLSLAVDLEILTSRMSSSPLMHPPSTFYLDLQELAKLAPFMTLKEMMAFLSQPPMDTGSMATKGMMQSSSTTLMAEPVSGHSQAHSEPSTDIRSLSQSREVSSDGDQSESTSQPISIRSTGTIGPPVDTNTLHFPAGLRKLPGGRTQKGHHK